ncbi:MAG: hypothetical protein KL863_15910 [Rhizobium sp.]|nr:hypothetical protein [Rhizobium sp.]
MGIEQKSVVNTARGRAAVKYFAPTATVKCEGRRLFRSRVSRDLACLLDVNPSVSSWICMPTELQIGDAHHIVDFAVFTSDGEAALFDAPDRSTRVSVEAVQAAAEATGWKYRRPSADEMYEGHRYRNARDLLRYGDHECSLGDRVRLQAALTEHGSLTLMDCLQMVRESKPMAAVASLILREFLEVDLDEGEIGPETMVRWIRT